MVLGGLWHGAGWNFVIWGGLHGVYLAVNHAWRGVFRETRIRSHALRKLYRTFAWLLTFLAVVFGWVFFRASDYQAAILITEAMLGNNGAALPNGIVARMGGFGDVLLAGGISTLPGGGSNFVLMTLWVSALMLIATVLPNTQQLMHRFEPALAVHPPSDADAVQPIKALQKLAFSLNYTWCVSLSVIATVAILTLHGVSEFLYYQF